VSLLKLAELQNFANSAVAKGVVEASFLGAGLGSASTHFAVI